MKKLLASVGLVALGVSTLHAQYSPGVTSAEMAKPWSLAATLRGFYDDNYLTQPSGTKGVHSSFGTEISPSASLNHTVNNTAFNLSYVYDWRYFENTGYSDSSHQLNASLKQTFSERYNMQVSDSFVIASEPTLIDSSIQSSPLYTQGNNIHNDGTITLNAELTPKLDLQFSYENNLYAYQQVFGDVYNPNPTALNSSRSALLDRMEQLGTVNLKWKMMGDLVGVAGYRYGHTGYTSPEPIIFAPTVPAGGIQSFGTPGNVFSQIRNNDAHFFFVGADQTFTSQLSGQIRVGAEYLDYYNVNKDDLGPYVDASLLWMYQKASSVQAGVKHQHSATDVVGNTAVNGQPVLDAETTAAYVSVNHTIAGGFTGGLLGQFQHSVFNGGAANGQSEDFYILGLNFAYRFNRYLSAETGYNWNRLVSDEARRGYARDIVYLGVRGTY